MNDNCTVCVYRTNKVPLSFIFITYIIFTFIKGDFCGKKVSEKRSSKMNLLYTLNNIIVIFNKQVD